MSTYSKEYYEANKEAVMEQRRTYRERHPDRIVERGRRYRETLPFNTAFYQIKTRAKRKGIPFDITIDYLKEIWTSKCPVFGTDLQFFSGQDKGRNTVDPLRQATLDKMKPTKGYVKGNVQWMSKRANVMKHDGSLDEMVKLGEWAQKQKLLTAE